MLYTLIGFALASEVALLGWSPDERYVAFRTIENSSKEPVFMGTDCESVGAPEGEYAEEDPALEHSSNATMRCTKEMIFCPDYVSPETKIPFLGDLSISIFEVKTQRMHNLEFQNLHPVAPPIVIYEAGALLYTVIDEGGGTEPVSGDCTPHTLARTQLQKAKSMLNKYQIDVTSKGGSVHFEEFIRTDKNSNGTIGYSMLYSPPSNLDSTAKTGTQPTPPAPKAELIYLISMKTDAIDGTNAMTFGWSKLYQGTVAEEEEHFGGVELLDAAPFQSVFTAPWGGASKYNLHSVFHSPTGNLLLFVQENTTYSFYGQDVDVDLTFPLVIDANKRELIPR